MSGTLTIHPMSHGLTGTFLIDGLRVPVIASRNPSGGLGLSGPLLKGELRSDGTRIRGRVSHGANEYPLDGQWITEEGERVLRCEVTA